MKIRSIMMAMMVMQPSVRRESKTIGNGLSVIPLIPNGNAYQ